MFEKVYFDLTLLCNLRCGTCLNNSGNPSRHSLLLSTFELRSIPSGETYPFHVLSLVSGYNEGTFTVNENLLFLQQELVNFDIKLNIQPSDEKVVTAEEFEILTGDKFTPSIGGPTYTFSSIAQEITLYEEEAPLPFFLGKMPAGTAKSVLLPNGEIITLEMTEEGTALVSE